METPWVIKKELRCLETCRAWTLSLPDPPHFLWNCWIHAGNVYDACRYECILGCYFHGETHHSHSDETLYVFDYYCYDCLCVYMSTNLRKNKIKLRKMQLKINCVYLLWTPLMELHPLTNRNWALSDTPRSTHWEPVVKCMLEISWRLSQNPTLGYPRVQTPEACFPWIQSGKPLKEIQLQPDIEFPLGSSCFQATTKKM